MSKSSELVLTTRIKSCARFIYGALVAVFFLFEEIAVEKKKKYENHHQI